MSICESDVLFQDLKEKKTSAKSLFLENLTYKDCVFVCTSITLYHPGNTNMPLLY